MSEANKSHLSERELDRKRQQPSETALGVGGGCYR